MRILRDLITYNVDSSEDEDGIEIIKEETACQTDAVSSKELLACRACLSTDVELYSLQEYKLDGCFGDFTGNPVLPEDGLPQHLCCMCRALLRKAVAFKRRCQEVQSYLLDIMMWKTQLKTEDVKSVTIDSKLPLNITHTLKLDIFVVQDSDVQESSSKHTYVYSLLEAIAEENRLKEKRAILNINTEHNYDIVPNTTNEEKKSDTVFFEASNINISNDILNAITINGGHIQVNMFDSDFIIGDLSDTTGDNECVQIANELDTAPDILDLEIYSDNDNFSDVEMENVNKNNTSEQDSKKNNTKKITTAEYYEKLSNDYHIDIVYPSKEELLEEMEITRSLESFKNSVYKCELCCHTFTSKAICSKHSRFHEAKPNDFECEFCHKRYQTKKSLKNHKHRNHEMWFSCRLCDNMSKFPKHAIKHYTEVHYEAIKYKCKDCPQRFKSNESLMRHVSRLHAPRRCAECGASATGGDALREHLRTHEEDHKCSTCNVGFRNSDALEKHQCGKNSCVTCGQGFDSKKEMMRHLKTGHRDPMKRCEECDFVCYTEKDMNNHWMKEHKGQKRPSARVRKRYIRGKVSCPICSLMVTDGALKRHLETHADMKYQCRFCGRRFRFLFNLEGHENIHTGTRPFKCPDCPATFSTYVQKAKHKIKIHLNKKYQCSRCRKCFVSQENLDSHNQYRSNCNQKPANNSTTQGPKKYYGTKVYNCKYCRETFKSSYRFYLHKDKVHGLKKTYQCDQCGKTFPFKPNLVAHIKTHSRDRPYKCKLCARTYKRKWGLEEHMNTHTGAKPFKCSLCSESFGSYWARYEHKMRDHFKQKRERRARKTTKSDEE